MQYEQGGTTVYIETWTLIYLGAIIASIIGLLLIFKNEDKHELASLRRSLRFTALERDSARKLAADYQQRYHDSIAFDRIVSQIND